MAACDSTATQATFFEYNEQVWGDLIYGTKDALQAIGLGIGLAFPGEAGGPKRELNTTDPRGFKCRITDGSFRSAGVYCASIKFPDRERPEALGGWKHFARGVQRKANTWADEFIGTADDLVSAGLSQPGQFPGCPGMRKVTVTVLPDGSIPNGAPTANHRETRSPGAKSITIASKANYRVELYISEELKELRWKEEQQARDEWEKKMDSLPRPPRIDGKPSQKGKSIQEYLQHETVADWKNGQMLFFDVLRLKAEDHPCIEELNSRFKYDAASRMKILAKLDELERAIKAGVVLHKTLPEQTNDGNVISIRRNTCPNTDSSWI